MTPYPEQTETNAPAQATPQSAQPPVQVTPTNPMNSAVAPTAQPAASAPQQQSPATTGAYAPYNPYGAYAQQNPYGAYNPYAQYPQYPQYQYPQYPGYSPYAYPGYAPYAPPAAPAAGNGATGTTGGASGATTQVAAKGRRPGLYALIFGVTLTVLLVAVIALAAVAPSLRTSETGAIPQGWTRVYDANLTTGNDGRWDQSNGCSSQPDGLEAGGPTSDSTGGVCIFEPSATTDLTSQGFLLNVTLAAPNNVPGDQQPVINVGATTYVTVNQQGTYDICASQCDTTTPGSIYATGSTSAWHEDGFVGNTIGVELSADGSTLTLFVNGVEVTSVSISVTSSSPTVIAIGALQGAQAIFTHATLYSGSATGI